MARIAYILLCHKDPLGVIAQVRALTKAGDCVAIHFDKRAPMADFEVLTEAFAGDPSVTFAPRVKCGWGEWSLVDATLRTLRRARKAFGDATHFFLISGDCMPIKPARYCHERLEAQDADIIESVDFFTSGWIRTGFVEERLIYRHLFNERSQKALFYASFQLQRTLGLTRKLPRDFQMRIGSQWWCLRRSTVNAVLKAVSERPQLVRFFRTTWIPDETFFQSLVYDLVPRREIVSESPTFLMFSDYGMPVNFYNDHYDYLLGQPQMFARKISGEATDLKTALNALYPQTDLDIDISGEGRGLYAFVTGKGRIGRRFGPRFWERDGDRAADRKLYIVACKKWHVARRFLDTVSVVSNMPALDYVFDEEGAQVPDLGGIESTLEKRRRHRRAVVGLLFDHFGSDSMVICIDPSNLDLMRDFYSDRSDVRLLSIECAFSDAYLDGHARRVGILSDRSPASVARRVIPTVRNDIASEIVAIRDARFPSFYRVAEDADPADNAAAIAGFLSITPDMARQISDVPHLFAD